MSDMSAAQMLDMLYKMPAKAEQGILGEVAHFFTDGLYVRRSVVQPGGLVKMHVHNYDHVTIAFGVGDMLTEDGNVKVMPGDVLHIKAGKKHSYLAKTMTIWFCIHPTAEAEARELYALH